VELRHLRYFVAVAEEGNFGRAAARLHLSTPTLSQQIRALESEIGAPLLVRHPHGATLTTAGQALLPNARMTLRTADTAILDARRAAGLTDATLRVGLLTGVSERLVSRLVEIVADDAAGAVLQLVAGSTSHQLGLLERGELDLAIVRGPVASAKGIEQLEVQRDALGVLMAAGHPLARQARVTYRELSGYELIWFPRYLAPGFYDATLQALERNGARLTVTTGTDSVPAIAAALPLLPTAISLSTARLAAGTPDLAWRPIEGSPPTATIVAIWRSRPRQPGLRALVDGLRRALTDGSWHQYHDQESD
jgi:DNA-binding transcriptional LysR family regulator